jgi:aminoglycoside phosphotransferase family enzyme/predicted kinase
VIPLAGEQAEVVRFLEAGGLGAGPVERIDTHAAVVLLAGEHAWKMKRAVRYSFLDFTTLEKREAALRHELDVNAGAAGLYLGVVPVTRTEDGGLVLGGTGRAVEWLLQMRRFDREQELDRIAQRGELDDALVDRLAAVVAQGHERAARHPECGGAAAMLDLIGGNRDDLGRLVPDVLAAEDVDALDRCCRMALGARATLWDRRRTQGFVRHCHGDLHLGNIVRIAGEPVPFDAIEFDDSFARIDIVYDLAFLIMDCWHRGLRRQAQRVLQGWLERTVDDEGMALLPLSLAIRAAIRAKVTGFAGDAVAARAYLALAQRSLEVAEPRLIAIGGRSGTGKSTLAAALAPELGAIPGAVVLRSDVIRKRRLGREPTTRLPETAYTPDMSHRVFRTIAQRARVLLDAGRTVIADGVYGEPAHRAAIEAVASRRGLRFDGFWLTAPQAMLEARVLTRLGDASDATVEVVRRQAAIDDRSVGWTRVDAGRDLATIRAELLRVLVPGRAP